MRILFAVLSPLTAELGAAQMALNLADALRRRGVDAVVWSPYPIPPELPWWRRMTWIRQRITNYVKDDSHFDAVDVPPVAVSGPLTGKTRVVARSVQPDLLYLWSDLRYAWRLVDTRLSTWIATAVWNLYLSLLVLAGWSRAYRILCLGKVDYRRTIRWFPWLRAKTAMYVNALSDEERKALAAIRSHRSTSERSGRRFLWLGRWAAHKGNDVLVAFMRMLLRQSDHDTITIAGCGQIAERQLPAEVRDSNRVRVVPSYDRNGLMDLLATHDAGLFTSRVEGWGLTLQEMLESGMPVYATSAGAVADLSPAFGDELLPFPPPPSGRAPAPHTHPLDAAYLNQFSWDAIAADYLRHVCAEGDRV
jgi:glycosyltransferase involved in cell wall biosynthesis